MSEPCVHAGTNELWSELTLTELKTVATSLLEPASGAHWWYCTVLDFIIAFIIKPPLLRPFLQTVYGDQDVLRDGRQSNGLTVSHRLFD